MKKEKEKHQNVKGTKEETIDVDIPFSGCESGCLSIARLCVFETSDVAWCELFHGGCKNSGLFGFS